MTMNVNVAGNCNQIFMVSRQDLGQPTGTVPEERREEEPSCLRRKTMKNLVKIGCAAISAIATPVIIHLIIKWTGNNPE